MKHVAENGKFGSALENDFGAYGSRLDGTQSVVKVRDVASATPAGI